MAYRFISFAGVTLPIYNTQVEWTGGVAPSTLVETINGSFDTHEGERVVPRKATYTLRAIVATAAGGTPTALTQVNALRALIGKTGALIREPRGGGDDQSTTARLLSVALTAARTPSLEEVTLTFEAATPYWQGASGSANRSSTTISATNGGNAPVRDATLTVTGAVSASVTVTATALNWTWTGTLSAGQTLVVTGNTVTANGQPATVTINEGHTSDVLIELEPGANTLTVTGGASASLAWNDAWQ
jgi:hypothetical protein